MSGSVTGEGWANVRSNEMEGTCSLMCPISERQWREKNGLLHRYEIDMTEAHNTKKMKADVHKAVKQYSRPAAGRESSNRNELRPLPVLLQTVKYLIESIMNKDDEKWIDIYEFCSDRFRAVCQDMTIQRITGPDSAWILVAATRFYIYSDYRLFQETSVCRFDAHINCSLLMECLKRFLLLNTDTNISVDSKVIAEMTAIYILFNLGSEDALRYSLSLDKSIRSYPVLSDAIRIGLAHLVSNYLFVLKAAARLPFLLACCLHRHVECLRRDFLLRLATGFSSKNCRFPISLLSRWLQLKDEGQTADLCRFYGINVDKDHVILLKASFDSTQKQAERRRDEDLDLQVTDVDVVRLIRGTQSAATCSSVVTAMEQLNIQ